MSDRASINFDRIAPIYEQSRGGLVRGRSYAGTITPHLLPGAVLEIGIGTGSIALPITEAGHPVVGVDLSPNMLELAYQRLGARVAVGDVMLLPIRTAACRTWSPCGSSSSSERRGHAARRARRCFRWGRLVVIPSCGTTPDDIDAVSVDFQTEIAAAVKMIPESSSRLRSGELAPGRTTRDRGSGVRRVTVQSPIASKRGASASCSTSTTRPGTSRHACSRAMRNS
jgi:SAM-dependent methyltransferase